MLPTQEVWNKTKNGTNIAAKMSGNIRIGIIILLINK